MVSRNAPLVVSGLTVTLTAVSAALVAIEPSRGGLAYAGLATFSLVWTGLGVVIARRGAGRFVGLLMAVVAVNLAFLAAKESGWIALAARPDLHDSLAWLVAILNESAWWLLAALALLFLYFPNGQLPSQRWRPLPWMLLACCAVNSVSSAFTEPFRPPLADLPRPFPAPSVWLENLAFVAFLGLMLSILLATASVIVRFRRAEPRGKAQIKWLALGALGVPGFPAVCLLEILVTGNSGWLSLSVAVATIIGLPIAITIAMLRHDLYDVDRAISAAVSYGAASGALVLVFVGVAAGAGAALGRDSALIVAVATAAAVAALAPLQRVAQKRVDHHLYPQREAALLAIRSLEQRTHTGESRPEQLEADLRVALRDPELRVAYQLPGRERLVDSRGTPVAAGRSVPITIDGSDIGALIPSSDALSTGLLREVALATGTLVEIVRLRVELNAAVVELESSRQRLVEASDRERLRLERDLHDGAQQRLVTLGMSLRLAQRHLGDHEIDVDALIDRAVAELGTAVSELRQIAHGLRPSRLDDGLPSALEALSRGFPVPIDLDVSPVDIPDQIATTIYFVASEALANAVKYANASRIGVRVARRDASVEVSVRDDGNGGAVLRHGSGLAGLRDRVSALGGSFTISANAGHGTIIHAELPCAS